MHKSVLLAGFGGQGVMFAGQLLAYAAMDAGLEVTWIPSYGPEMRGGTAHCYVAISDKPIGSPIAKHPDVVLAFNNPSFTKYEPVVMTGGLLVSNASLITQKSQRDDIRHLPVPATAIADEIGNLKLMNVVMLGAVLTVDGVIPLETLKAALAGHIPAHHRDLLPDNYAALERGAAFANAFVAA